MNAIYVTEFPAGENWLISRPLSIPDQWTREDLSLRMKRTTTEEIGRLMNFTERYYDAINFDCRFSSSPDFSCSKTFSNRNESPPYRRQNRAMPAPDGCYSSARYCREPDAGQLLKVTFGSFMVSKFTSSDILERLPTLFNLQDYHLLFGVNHGKDGCRLISMRGNFVRHI